MSAPVKHTCPDIDALIKRLKDIGKLGQEGMREHEKNSDDHQRYKDIEWFVDSMIDITEKLRQSNASLRDWGEDLEKKVAELEDDKYLLEQEIEELKLSHAAP